MEEHSYSGFKTPKQKRPWSKEEDEKLLCLIDKFGTSDWKETGVQMESRSGKQCRERYFNHLKEGINKRPWTNEEDKIIYDKYVECGPKWSSIAKCVSGRPDNAVKNRWHLLQRKGSCTTTSPDANEPKVIGLGEKTVRFSDDYMLNKSSSADSNEAMVANNFDRKSWKRDEIQLLLSSVKDKQNWLQIGHLFPNRSILCVKQKFESITAKERKDHGKIQENVTTAMSNTACMNIRNAKRALSSPPVTSSKKVTSSSADRVPSLELLSLLQSRGNDAITNQQSYSTTPTATNQVKESIIGQIEKYALIILGGLDLWWLLETLNPMLILS